MDLRHLSDTELITHLDSLRAYSPVIKELLERLENTLDIRVCPICKGDVDLFRKEN
jgi:hypothetical protein